MDFQKAITISGKIYDFLKRFNLQEYFKVDAIIDNYYPQILSRLQNYAKTGKIAVCSTNGKKTTTTILNQIISENNQTYISNVDETPLKNPVLTSIVLELSKSQEPRDYYTMAFDEYEIEAYFNSMKFNYLLLNNILYDHKDFISCMDKRKYIQNAIVLNSKLNLVINADDAYLYGIDEIKNDTILNRRRKKLFYGFNNVEFYNNAQDLGQRNDVLRCPNCGCELVFDKHFYSHLGHYNCECGFKRPKPDIVADASIFPNYLFLTVYYNGDKYAFKMAIGGLYNAYNALGAIAMALELNIPRKIIGSALEKYAPLKSREEVIEVKDKNIKIKIAKNPASLSENLRELYYTKTYKVIFCLGDTPDDGVDTSWRWDANFKALENFENKIFVSGKRFDDMALRLKYARVNPSLIIMDQSISHAIECCYWDLEDNESMLIITTESSVNDIYSAIKKCLQ